MKYLILFLACFSLISCGNEVEPSTQELIDNADVDGLEQNDLEWSIKSTDFVMNSVWSQLLSTDWTPPKKRALVSVDTVKPSELKHRISLQSIVKTNQNMLLHPEFMGAVSSISVREGQQVKKGQVLMRIDDGGLKQTIRLQKAQTDMAKTVFERQERLWNEQIGSEIEYLQAKTNYESQRSQLGQLNDQLEKADRARSLFWKN